MESGVGLPPHACEAIEGVLKQDGQNVAAATEIAQRRVRAGWMTPQDLARQQEAIKAAGPEMARFCSQYCNVGRCAMQRFGKDLVGVDPSELSEEDKARLGFYRTVDETRYVTEMRLGVAL